MMEWRPREFQRGGGERVRRKRRPKGRRKDCEVEENSACIECGILYFHSIFCSRNVEAIHELAQYERESDKMGYQENLLFSGKEDCYPTTENCESSWLREYEYPSENSSSEATNLMKTIDDKNRIIRDFETTCEAMEVGFEEDRRTMKLEIDSLRNSMSELRINNELNSKTVLQLRRQLQDKNDQLEMYVDKFSKIEVDLGMKNKENTSMEAKLKLLEVSLAEIEKTHNEAVSTINGMHKEKAEILEETMRLKNELRMAQKQVDVLESMNNEHVLKLEEEVGENLMLQNQNDALRRSLELKLAEIVGYNNEIQRLNYVLVLSKQIARSKKQKNVNGQQLTVSHSLQQPYVHEKVATFCKAQTLQVFPLTQFSGCLEDHWEYTSHSPEEGQEETSSLGDLLIYSDNEFTPRDVPERFETDQLLRAGKGSWYQGSGDPRPEIKFKVTSAQNRATSTVCHTKKSCTLGSGECHHLTPHRKGSASEASIPEKNESNCTVAEEARTDGGKRGREEKTGDSWIKFLNFEERISAAMGR